MASSSENFQTLVGRVTDSRPGLPRPVYEIAVNDAIRACIDRQPVWAELIKEAVISFPAAYTTGTISLVNGSTAVTGSSTAWPVSDVVNTTLSIATEAPGISEFFPASMSGISADSLLLIDQGTPSEEVLAVVELLSDRFKASARYVHNAGVAIIQSSIVGRQVRVASAPVFTIEAVKSATSLLLDMAWGGADAAGTAYSIQKRYFTVDPLFKAFIVATDPQSGWPLELSVSQKIMATLDPRRQYGSSPVGIADFRANRNGNMMHELVNANASVRQIWVLYAAYWPKLLSAEDRPPWFINPSVFASLASAACLRKKTAQGDPFHDPALAREYERTAENLFQGAMVDNEAKVMQALQKALPRMPATYDPRQYEPVLFEWSF